MKQPIFVSDQLLGGGVPPVRRALLLLLGQAPGVAGGQQGPDEPGGVRAGQPAGHHGHAHHDPAAAAPVQDRGAPGGPLRPGARVDHRLGQAGARLHGSHTERSDETAPDNMDRGETLIRIKMVTF